jgi:outer membrane protein assembly factor BamA
MGLAKGSEIERQALPDLVQSIRAAYEARGYRDVEIEPILRDTDDPSRKVLIVRIREGRPTRIAAVRFVGDPPPKASGVRRAMEVEEGDIVEERLIQESVRAAEKHLWEKGYYEARLGPVRLEPVEGGLALLIRCETGRHFRLRVRGHAPLSRDEIIDAMRLGEERIGGAAGLTAAADRIEDLYRRRAMPDASVTIQTLPAPVQRQAWLLVDVTPGDPLTVTTVRFRGARHFDDEFLREQVESYLQEDLGSVSIFEPVDGDTVNRLGFGGHRRDRRSTPRPYTVEPAEVFYRPTYEEAVEHIQELYRADGFLGAQVGPARLERQAQDKATVTIPVVEGPRTRLHLVELRGNESLTSREILRAAGLERGMPFSRLRLEEARVTVLDLYKEHGYLYARVEPSVRFSGDRTRAKVVLQIVERYPVHVGEIVVRGATRTSEPLIRDRIALKRGELYRPSLARETQERLAALGAFTGVTVAPENVELPARVKPVVVTVNERKPQFMEFSGGISTVQGVRGGFEYGYRSRYAIDVRLRLQLAYQLFFFDSQLRDRLGGLSLAKRLERRVGLGIVVPHIPRLPRVRTSFDVFHQRNNERDFGLDKNGVALSFTYRPWRRLTVTVSEEFENSDVDLFVDVDSIEDLILNTTDRRLQRLLRVPEGESNLFSTNVGVSFDHRDNPFVPTKGYFLSGSAEWARTTQTQRVEVAEGSQRFFSNQLKLSVNASGYVPLGRRVVFATQLRVGRIYHLTDDSETYPNRRFFMGGVDTMRGYLEDSMIPQDLANRIQEEDELGPNSVLRGGDSFILLRGEVRFPVAGPAGGAVFADLGNLWATGNRLQPRQIRPTAGFGLRVETPVGPLALDLGIILLRREFLNERWGAVHFSFGTF